MCVYINIFVYTHTHTYVHVHGAYSMPDYVNTHTNGILIYTPIFSFTTTQRSLHMIFLFFLMAIHYSIIRMYYS